MAHRIVVALMGLPGAGKSTVAQFLCERVALLEVNRDRIRDAMFPDCRFSTVEKEAANQAVHQALLANCQLGRSSLIDGMTFARRIESDTLRESTLATGFEWLVIYLDCPVDVASARVTGDIETTGHPARDRNAQLVRRVANRFERPSDDVLRIDAAQSVDTVCSLALDKISRYVN